MIFPAASWGGGARAFRDWLVHVCGTFALDRLLVAFAAVAAVGAVFATQIPHLELVSRVSASQAGMVQLYYSDDGVFSELRTHVWPVAAARDQDVVFSVPTDDSAVLRLDPAAGVERTEFCGMRARLPDGNEIAIGIDRFSAASQVAVAGSADCVVVTSSVSSVDPQVRLDLSTIQEPLRKIRKTRMLVAIVLAMTSVALLLAAGAMARRTGRAVTRESEAVSLTAKLPVIYLVLALVVGGLFCVITPPGAVPDEPAHIAKTILVENGEWVGRADPDGLNPGMAQVLGPFGDFLNPSKRFHVSDVVEHAGRPLQCGHSSDKYPSTAAGYSPTMYVPGAYVLNSACHFNAPTGVFVYGGRFANLVVSVLLVFFGLRAAGGHAWPVFAVAILPMMFYEQASFTADSLVLALTLCIVGVQVGLATSQIRPGAWIEGALLVLGLAMALSKPGYAWVCVGFLFCLWSYRSAGRSFWSRVLLLVGLPWLIHVVWVLVSAESAVTRSGVDPRINVSLIFNEPIQTLDLWRRTFFGEGSGFLWSSLVGRLGWLDVVLHPGTYALAVAGMVVSLGMRGDATQPIPDWRVRPLATLFALGAMLLPALPMYLFWTAQGALMIEGLQGRYLIPSAAFCMAWLSFRLPVWWRSMAGVFVLCTAVVINLDALYRLVLRYYG